MGGQGKTESEQAVAMGTMVIFQLFPKFEKGGGFRKKRAAFPPHGNAPGQEAGPTSWGDFSSS